MKKDFSNLFAPFLNLCVWCAAAKELATIFAFGKSAFL
jgi:hypothetical protein